MFTFFLLCLAFLVIPTRYFVLLGAYILTAKTVLHIKAREWLNKDV